MSVDELKAQGWAFLFDALDRINEAEQEAGRVCPRCEGGGEIYWNDSFRRDPQCEESAVCPDCDGTGTKR